MYDVCEGQLDGYLRVILPVLTDAVEFTDDPVGETRWWSVPLDA